MYARFGGSPSQAQSVLAQGLLGYRGYAHCSVAVNGLCLAQTLATEVRPPLAPDKVLTGTRVMACMLSVLTTLVDRTAGTLRWRSCSLALAEHAPT